MIRKKKIIVQDQERNKQADNREPVLGVKDQVTGPVVGQVMCQVMGQVMGQVVWHVVGKRRGRQKMKKLPRIVTQD